jgi:hypothetical protein
MKLGDAEYVAKVQALLNSGQCVSRSEARRRISQSEEKMHTHKTMSEQETQAEIKVVTEGAESIFADGAVIKTADMIIEIQADKAGTITDISVQPKKRGRPKGSKNKPKA